MPELDEAINLAYSLIYKSVDRDKIDQTCYKIVELIKKAKKKIKEKK